MPAAGFEHRVEVVFLPEAESAGLGFCSISEVSTRIM